MNKTEIYNEIVDKFEKDYTMPYEEQVGYAIGFLDALLMRKEIKNETYKDVLSELLSYDAFNGFRLKQRLIEMQLEGK